MFRSFFAKKNEEKADIQRYGSPLFQIKKNSKVSYILGSAHTLPLNTLPQALIKIINQCKTLVLEFAPDNKLTLQNLRDIGFISPKENDWYQHLSKKALEILIKKLREFLKFKVEAGVSIKLSEFNPRLIPQLIDFANNYESLGMDVELAKQFKGKTHDLEGIERYEFCDTIKPLEIDELEQYILDHEKIDNEIGDYLNQDLRDTFPESDFLFKLLTKRNLRWINKIIDFHEKSDGPVLFAVGNAHLSVQGGTGILELLKEFGFEIRRFNLKGNLPALSMNLSLQAPQKHTVFMEDLKEAADIFTAREIELGTQCQLPPASRALIFSYLTSTPTLFVHPKLLSEHVEIENTKNGRKIQIKTEPVKLKFY